MLKGNENLVKGASLYILVAMLLQIARIWFGNAMALSVINQISLLIFMLFAFKFVGRFSGRLVALVILCHVALFVPAIYHLFAGKSGVVLLLGHLDNLKFLLPLSILLTIKINKWNVGKKAQLYLNILWWIVAVGVFFGGLQQISVDLAIRFFGEEDRLQYRYGLLRVPSYFSEINSFARASFLLMPLSVLVKKRVWPSVILAVIGMLLAFSRQFILGLMLSAFIATVFVFTERLSRYTRFVLILLASVVGYILFSLADVEILSKGEDDRLLTISEKYIRLAVFETSLDAVSDRPITGVGPGYFGGNVGKKFNVTEDLYGYGLLERVPYFDLSGAYYTDTLWPQLFAEYGVFGFFAILILMWLWLRNLDEISSVKFRVMALICYFQMIFAMAVSPVFNFLYFSLGILVLTFVMKSKGERV